jgi:hypothetical protein
MTATEWNCFDCNKLTRNLIELKTINVCAHCYAIRVGHPSVRKLVK